MVVKGVIIPIQTFRSFESNPKIWVAFATVNGTCEQVAITQYNERFNANSVFYAILLFSIQVAQVKINCHAICFVLGEYFQ
jgi:hypothetical protein